LGGSEVASLYGRHVLELASFCYQISLCFPWGFEIKKDRHALFDLLLNFESEPERRFLFWNDAQCLFLKSTSEFAEIFELIVSAGYCNRNAISTIKPDGSRYRVDQRTFFLFYDMEIGEIVDLVNKEYFMPSVENEGHMKELDFTIVKLVK
jgi:hypothetical protein